MKRRQFLTSSATAAAISSAAPAIGAANDRHEWKLVTSLPKGLPGPGVSADRLAQRVTEISGGRLTIKVFGGGDLVPAFSTQEAVEKGLAEMYHGSGSWFTGRNIGHAFYSVVPFGADVREFNAWVRHGGGRELWDELTEPRGFKCFTGGGSGVQSAGWYKKEIKSLDDLEGLNFRITGFGALVLRKIGMNPTALPPAEIFQALQAGTIDGAEWVGPSNDLAFGFHKVLRYMYTPSFSDIHGGVEYGINMEAWEKLPDDIKLIVQVCIEAETELMSTDIFYSNVQALERLAELGVEIGELPPDVWDALRTASAEVMAEVRESDPLIGRIHDSFYAFVGKAVDYRKLYDERLYAERRKYFS